MRYSTINNELFEEILGFHAEFLKRIEDLSVDIITYGGFSYMYFTGDTDIEVKDLDIIAPQATFPAMLERMKYLPGVTYQITDESVKFFRNGAKLSVHSQEKISREIGLENLERIRMNGVDFLTVSLDDLIACYRISSPGKPRDADKLGKLLSLAE